MVDDPMLVGGGPGDVVGVFVAIFVVVAVVGVAMSVRRAKKLHDAGIDPIDPETDLQVRWAQSRAMAPGAEKTTEERLAEVDQLYAAGTITPSERDAARARILGSI